MRIFQVKYNINIYVYYMAREKEEVMPTTKFYRSYIDCKDENAKYLDVYEQKKLYNSLVKFYLDAEL